jgi:hypothetical protein
MNRNLALEEHEPVDVTQAIQIADTYFGRATEKFATGENAIAATIFGFSRSPEEFIELCINGTTQISYKFEALDKNIPWLFKPWKGIFQHQEDLRSRDELIQRIQDFFSYSPDEILQRYKRQR